MKKPPRVINRLTFDEERQITKAIAKGEMSAGEIQKKFKCTHSTFYRLFWAHSNSLGKNPNVTKIGLSSKNEPYMTEDESLSSPFYNATNRERIKPIRADWKLY